jgi:hypothetical protein
MYCKSLRFLLEFSVLELGIIAGSDAAEALAPSSPESHVNMLIYLPCGKDDWQQPRLAHLTPHIIRAAREGDVHCSRALFAQTLSAGSNCFQPDCCKGFMGRVHGRWTFCGK